MLNDWHVIHDAGKVLLARLEHQHLISDHLVNDAISMTARDNRNHLHI